MSQHCLSESSGKFIFYNSATPTHFRAHLSERTHAVLRVPTVIECCFGSHCFTRTNFGMSSGIVVKGYLKRLKRTTLIDGVIIKKLLY